MIITSKNKPANAGTTKSADAPLFAFAGYGITSAK